MISESDIELFISLFNGREDIYARRWEREGKSGYMPAYDLEWDEYYNHKAKGGTYQSFENKKQRPYNKDAVLEHIRGKYTVGVYPLLQDNTSWFIAADFDEENWKEECLSYIKICSELNIPAYLERSEIR